MNPERPLVEWARRFRTTCQHSTPQCMREKLEATLLPMIRCALKTGLGQPTLVRWVRNQQALLRPDEQNDPARPLARDLCDHLMAGLTPRCDRETVLGV